jgi:hypothetical protein
MKIPLSPVRRMGKATVPALALAGLLQGCASPVAKQDVAGFESQMNAGDYAGAASTAVRSGQIGPDGKSQNIVWSLNASSALFDYGDVAHSIPILDNTENMMQQNDLSTIHAALDYKFTTYDGVMVNVYKALAYQKQGDSASARVEFKRAEDRQRRAEEKFKAEYDAAQQQIKQNDLQALFLNAQQSSDYRNDDDVVARMAAGYAPFENPFATYLAGIFLLTTGDGTASDREDALHDLRRASGMIGRNGAAVQADIAWAQAGKAAGKAPQTWVVFENGQSATFREIRLVLPMVTGHPMTIALPALTPNDAASAHLNVQAGGVTAATSPAGSFDAVMASEFRKRIPVILASAIVEAALKNGMSVAAQKSNNAAIRLISDVAANVSTADTRSWTALPKEFQVVRVATPADGHIALSTAEGASLGSVQVPTDRPSIVFVKLQHAGAQPGLQVIKL